MRILMITIGLWTTAAAAATAQEGKVRDVTADRAPCVATGRSLERGRGNVRLAVDAAAAAAFPLGGDLPVYPWPAVSLGW